MRPYYARAAISSIAHYVPSEVRDNGYFERRHGTSDDWIRTRTGIAERRIAATGGTSELIVPAALACLSARGVQPDEIDCIVVATITPDHFFPSTAAIVQSRVGAKNAWGYDLSAACSGFRYGLVTASKLVESGACRRVLLCGADKMSSITNYEDRSTSVLFGDAAAAAIVECTDDPDIGVLDHICRIEGSGVRNLFIPAGGSSRPASPETVANGEHCLVQEGQAVFKAAVTAMSEVTAEIMARNGLTRDELSWLLPHQANRRILEAVAGRLGVCLTKVMSNLDRYGNTSAASIPLCLSEWHHDKKLNYGDSIVLTSFGAGYSIGSVYLRWGLSAPN
jgi:3-oxoacyl-[acyl-carrier-protein] synthase III